MVRFLQFLIQHIRAAYVYLQIVFHYQPEGYFFSFVFKFFLQICHNKGVERLHYHIIL